jgi:hypothetical protein
VHEDAPVLLESRWCLSYLRGPLSSAQIGTLMTGRKSAQTAAPAASLEPVAALGSAPAAPSVAAVKTVLPSSIPQTYLSASGLLAGAAVTYRPALLAAARIHLVDLKQGLDSWQTVRHLVIPDAHGNLSWTAARPAPQAEQLGPVPNAAHESVPAALSDPKRFAQYEKDYKVYLAEAGTIELLSLPAHKLVANPGEGEGNFRIRAGQLLREKRDAAVEEIRKKYALKLTVISERERRAMAKVENEKAQLSRQRLGTAVSFGAAALSILLGRRAGGIGRATTGIGSMTRSGKEKLDVQQAGETLESIRRQKADLEAEVETAAAELAGSFDPANLAVTTLRIVPRRSDTSMQQLALAWIPCVPDAFGVLRPAIEL